jgi:hypothetical protein
MIDATETKREKLLKQLESVTEKENQIKLKLRTLDAKEKEAIRKKETRAKIVLGGFLTSHAKKGNEDFIKLIDQAISESSERDSKLLTDYNNLIIKGGK